jgi:hypothetical protein
MFIFEQFSFFDSTGKEILLTLYTEVMVTKRSEYASENMVTAAATGLVMQFTELLFVNDYVNCIIT